MAMDWSDTTAVAALALSLLALYQTSRHRGGDILLNAIRERAELEEILKGLDGAATTLLNEWRGVFSARGMLPSGAMIKKEQTTQQIGAHIDELQSALSAIEKPDGLWARRRAESILTQLITLRARADAVVAAINGERVAIYQDLEAFRNRPR